MQKILEIKVRVLCGPAYARKREGAWLELSAGSDVECGSEIWLGEDEGAVMLIEVGGKPALALRREGVMTTVQAEPCDGCDYSVFSIEAPEWRLGRSDPSEPFAGVYGQTVRFWPGADGIAPEDWPWIRVLTGPEPPPSAPQPMPDDLQQGDLIFR